MINCGPLNDIDENGKSKDKPKNNQRAILEDEMQQARVQLQLDLKRAKRDYEERLASCHNEYRRRLMDIQRWGYEDSIEVTQPYEHFFEVGND